MGGARLGSSGIQRRHELAQGEAVGAEKLLDGDVLAWILGGDNPSVRGRALVDLLDRPEGARGGRPLGERAMIETRLRRSRSSGYLVRAED